MHNEQTGQAARYGGPRSQAHGTGFVATDWRLAGTASSITTGIGMHGANGQSGAIRPPPPPPQVVSGHIGGGRGFTLPPG